MPFSIEETIEGLRHLRLRWQRQVLRRPVDAFVGRLEAGGLPCKEQPGPDGAVCPVCGFALARLTFSSGWTVETCSATALPSIAARDQLVPWLNELSRAQTGSSGTADVSGDVKLSPAGETADLPGPHR